jgi:hypothetical protein
VLFFRYHLNILIPRFLPLHDYLSIIFHHMIQLSTVCARCTRIMTISCQMSRMVTIIEDDQSSSSIEYSSSPNSESSSSSLIISPHIIIFWYTSFHSIFSLNFVCIHCAFYHYIECVKILFVMSQKLTKITK